jgi:hypothetical protein
MPEYPQGQDRLELAVKVQPRGSIPYTKCYKDYIGHVL